MRIHDDQMQYDPWSVTPCQNIQIVLHFCFEFQVYSTVGLYTMFCKPSFAKTRLHTVYLWSNQVTTDHKSLHAPKQSLRSK